ncbi:hypothetical protein LTR60_003447 [Cryomyces antarcticus]|nr:hypothetical protein LTR39_003527 [Cryomyces antarcticus]KAK5014258.1 hypothetical protein LTR60_003447 [Cryomyces antarcticus]
MLDFEPKGSLLGIQHINAVSFLTSLPSLAHRLITRGPVRTLPTPRRVRAFFNHTCVVDTTHALYVWEHEYYPQFYVPQDTLKQGCWSEKDDIGDGAKILNIHVGDRETDRVIAFGAKAGALNAMVRIEFGSVDAWLEEDTPIYVHPKDPFKRIDILDSIRPIKISIDGVVVASAPASMHLYETTLPTRYYLPLTSVDFAVLRTSKTVTACPYKGEAEYYDVVVNGKTHKDVIWYYRRPTLECALVAGHICFYNEKVDIELDGVKLERPKTFWS